MESISESGRADAFDRERGRIFLEKADIAFPDEKLAALRSADDASLGIEHGFLRDALAAFAIPASTPLSRARSQGTFHRLYDVHEPGNESRLMRVAAIPGPSSADLMSLECALMGELRRKGLPVPTCEYREVRQDGLVRGVHLMGRARGMSLTTCDDDEARTLAALAWVAQFLANLHRLRGDGFGPISLARLREAQDALRFAGVHRQWDDYLFQRLPEHVQSCEASGAISTREAADVAALFAAARPALRTSNSMLLHGDPGSHNFIVDESGIGAVLDWEDALLGDPLFDLASLCTFHPERRYAAIWSAYGAALAPRSDGWTRFWLYFLRIALAKTVHRSRFASADRVDRPPASRRIQLALARLGETG